MNHVKTPRFWVLIATIITTVLVLTGLLSPLHSIFLTDALARLFDCLFALVLQIFVTHSYVSNYKKVKGEKNGTIQTPKK